MTKKYFNILLATPTFFIFTAPGEQFFIAEGKDGAEPRFEDARPIKIRTADREYCEVVKPRTLRADSISYMNPTDGETPSEIFKQDIAELPPEAQAFLLERFGNDLKKADDWFTD